MSGRVGSTLDPGGAQVASLVDRDQPSAPDELERRERALEGRDDSMLEPDRAPSTGDDRVDPIDPRSNDERRRQEMEKLRNQGLEDIKVIPGEAAPPTIY